MRRAAVGIDIGMRYLANLQRVLPMCCAIVCLGAHASGASAHSVLPNVAWQEPGAGRLVLATLGERWMIATNSPRRGVTPGRGAGAAGPALAPALPRPSPSRQAAAWTARDVMTATTTGPGQGGYVHYFVIEAPDGEREIQVGIELPDARIAWSVPELGVVVSPFIDAGELQTGGGTYTVRHLYGIRPFRDDEAMVALQKDLWRRVIPWVEDATPYCPLASSSSQPCLSCLGFVLRVLYPSHSGGMPALPPDFERSGASMYFTTEDLLLYQAGLQGSRSQAERMARIHALTLPQNLRDDLIRIAQSIEPDDDAGSVAAARPRKITAKKRPPARSISKAGQPRPSPPKKL